VSCEQTYSDIYSKSQGHWALQTDDAATTAQLLRQFEEGAEEKKGKKSSFKMKFTLL
jgi:hypothetical protein